MTMPTPRQPRAAPRTNTCPGAVAASDSNVAETARRTSFPTHQPSSRRAVGRDGAAPPVLRHGHVHRCVGADVVVEVDRSARRQCQDDSLDDPWRTIDVHGRPVRDDRDGHRTTARPIVPPRPGTSTSAPPRLPPPPVPSSPALRSETVNLAQHKREFTPWRGDPSADRRRHAPRSQPAVTLMVCQPVAPSGPASATSSVWVSPVAVGGPHRDGVLAGRGVHVEHPLPPGVVVEVLAASVASCHSPVVDPDLDLGDARGLGPGHAGDRTVARPATWSRPAACRCATAVLIGPCSDQPRGTQ